jgi:NAD(P)-dependent dehydrogenase (short-subunit alcohol dehydrogenase family)
MSRLFMVTLSSLLFFLLAFIIQLTNRVAYKVLDKGAIVISGASTGIGRYAAEYIANHFSDYTIYDGVRNTNDARSIENLRLRNLFPLMLDVTSEESCEMAIDRVKNDLIERNLTLVALVNYAGVALSYKATISL